MNLATLAIQDINELKNEYTLDYSWDYNQSAYDIYDMKTRPNTEHVFNSTYDPWNYDSDIARIY